MANILLAYQNRTDLGSLSGGSWLAALPLSNLQNRLVQRVARSSNAALASTKFDIDLGAAYTIDVLSLVVHNISVSGKVRVTAASDAAFSSVLYQSAWVDVWPSGMIPQNLLEWEEDNFWLGTLSSQARAGYQSPYIHQVSPAQYARYWRVEVDDTTNTDGYVQIGRLFMSQSWTPSINYDRGADLVYKDTTPIETSLSGAEYFDVRSRVREFTFTLSGLSDSEAYDSVLQIQRLCGINGEILMISDKDDTTRIPARAYVGRLAELDGIGQTQNGRFKVNMKIRELI